MKRPILCRIGLHKWCKHPEVRSATLKAVSSFDSLIRTFTIYRCTECLLPHDHCEITGRWLPVSDEQRCVKCETVKTH